MFELFNEDGHLTPDALKATAQQQPLDELSRLEIAEHFSFCDVCLSAYTQLLTDDTLVAPPQLQAEKIMKRITQKTRILFFNRYVRVSVAACLAITLWACGVFTFDYIGANNQFVASISATSASVSIQMEEWGENLRKDLASFFQYTKPDGNRLKGASSNEKE